MELLMLTNEESSSCRLCEEPDPGNCLFIILAVWHRSLDGWVLFFWFFSMFRPVLGSSSFVICLSFLLAIVLHVTFILLLLDNATFLVFFRTDTWICFIWAWVPLCLFWRASGFIVCLWFCRFVWLSLCALSFLAVWRRAVEFSTESFYAYLFCDFIFDCCSIDCYKLYWPYRVLS